MTKICLVFLVGIIAVTNAKSGDEGGSLRRRATGVNAPSNNDVSKEDKVFWDRLMQEVDGSVLPPTESNPNPTDAPGPVPTIPAETTAAPVPSPTPPRQTAMPAPSPTTEAPVPAPMAPPTVAPVPSPTTAPVTTETPTASPIMAPVSDSPVPSPTTAPVSVTTEAPTASPTTAPVIAETDAPAAAPTTEAPVAVEGTDAPVFPPTISAATDPPVPPPTTDDTDSPATGAPSSSATATVTTDETDSPTGAPSSSATTSAPIPAPTTNETNPPATEAPSISATTTAPVSTPVETDSPATGAPSSSEPTTAPVPAPTADDTDSPTGAPSSSATAAVTTDETDSPETGAPSSSVATTAPVPAPTSVETDSPATAAPVSSATTPAPTTYPRAITNAPTFPPRITDPPRPGLCPTRVHTSCATVFDNRPCQQVPIPEDPSDPDCIVPVIYTYNMTNFGDDTRRIYSLTVLRNNELIIVTNIPDVIPIILLEPGGSYIAKSPEVVVLDVCTFQGLDIFDAKVDVTGGFPVTSENTVACISDEGEACEDIIEDPNADDCLLNVTYTYTIQNVAEISFNVWRFNRTRAGENVDLMPLLVGPEGSRDNFVDIGGSLSVQETEEINRCESLPSFETNLTVRKEPPFDTLCRDTYYYPIGEIPNHFEG